MPEISKITPKDLARFWVKVKKTNNCWLWTANRRDGYGQFYFNGKLESAHRLSYELFKGDIPTGLQLDHLCRNRACINPDHLEAVTHKVNCQRGLIGQTTKTHCVRDHKFTEESVYHRKDGSRQCKECSDIHHHQIKVRASYARDNTIQL